jgi:hypothetical protein
LSIKWEQPISIKNQYGANPKGTIAIPIAPKRVTRGWPRLGQHAHGT